MRAYLSALAQAGLQAEEVRQTRSPSQVRLLSIPTRSPKPKPRPLYLRGLRMVVFLTRNPPLAHPPPTGIGDCPQGAGAVSAQSEWGHI